MGYVSQRQGCALLAIALVACAEASAPPDTYGLDTRPPNAACRAFTAPPPSGKVRLAKRFPNVQLEYPTSLAQRPNDNNYWYVLERTGRILRFPNRPDVAASEVTVALDLRDVTYHETDCSLASLAFPPDFATSKRAYVSYCHITSDGLQIRVSRFATADGGVTFERASEEPIIAIDYPPSDYAVGAPHDPPGLHAADAMHFGRDGYLYVALGDGGPRTALGPQQSQNIKDLRGKLLRIDVSDLSKKLVDDGITLDRQRIAAGFPADNPFVGMEGNAPAVYAYGLRNPWQWHFDRKTGAIWLGDVGAESWEEVDRDVQKGANYGWGIYEGTHCTNLLPGCPDPSLKQPWLDYAHGSGQQEGGAVVGGVVYRGSAVPSMAGAYIFGDVSKAHIWQVSPADQGLSPPTKKLLFDGIAVASFAEDQDGELFVVSLLPGEILALEELPAAPPPAGGGAAAGGPPLMLSQTGCFDAANQMEPTSDLIPFAPAAELWSDGADKRRWMMVPDAQTITVGDDGDFNFPPGTVLVKEFSLSGTKVETRFLVRQQADERWAGYSYRWNDAQTDATLVEENGATAMFGGQVWNYPTRAQCQQCHTNAAGNSLGPEIAQLNYAFTYPATGRSGNQVATLAKIGVLDPSAMAKPWPKLASVAQADASLEQRARSYLHANCSNCHRPGGPTFTPPDFRFSTPLADMGICNASPTISSLEELIASEPRLLAPGDPDRSVLFVRLSTTDQRFRMPPIGRTITHDAGVDVVSQWIRQNSSCP